MIVAILAVAAVATQFFVAAAAGRFCCRRRVVAIFACNCDCDGLSNLQNTLIPVLRLCFDTSIAQIFCSVCDTCPDIWLKIVVGC